MNTASLKTTKITQRLPKDILLKNLEAENNNTIDREWVDLMFKIYADVEINNELIVDNSKAREDFKALYHDWKEQTDGNQVTA